MKNIASLFARQVERRCSAKIVSDAGGSLTVKLAIEPGIGAEGFKIADEAGAVRIVGNDRRGVLYGAGKFLRTSRYDRGGFTPGDWRGTSVPEKPVRGIYFATHFYNYYQAAPSEEVEQYIQELSLWGVNTLLVWYDAHHFQGFDDPEAVAFRRHLKRILQAARKLDVGVGLIVIGNEAYDNSPMALRADLHGYRIDQRGSYYDVDVCPNKPGGMEYVLRILGELFDWSADMRPEYVCLWPYDPGSCNCAKCRPWGSNGFLKCAEQIAGLARKKLPAVKIIVSTWLFDAGEWQAMKKAFSPKPAWVDVVMAENPGFVRDGMPGVPIIGFPEISMCETFPWGAFGASSQPWRFAGQWRGVHEQLAGGFPYSEGIFEDVNKVVFAQCYWNSNIPVEATLKEYIAYEYSPDVADDVLKVIGILEKNHHYRWWPGLLEGVKLTWDAFPSKGAKPRADPGAEEAYAIVKRVDAKLPAWARSSWRWRILYLRAMFDSELKTNGGKPTKACWDGFQEVNRIYHVMDKTDPMMKAPSEK